jgi:hypothetical protein
MLNARRVDSKFWISGGWQDIERDIQWAKTENIRAILDLQYTSDDDQNIASYIRDLLADEGIEYYNILMYDGDWNTDLPAIFLEGENRLELWDTKFTGKKDRILIKCGAGCSRSVAQYLNYICYRDKFDVKDVYGNLVDYEAKWALVNSPRNFYPSSPDPCFTSYLKKKYSVIESSFGEIERED